MPCNSDHMHARPNEVLSRETAKLIVYANDKLGAATPANIAVAANEYYGDETNVDEIVRTLCEIVTGMTPEQRDQIVYDGKDPTARQLADWWDRHQAADRAREAAAQTAIEAKRVEIAEQHGPEMVRLIADILDDLPLLGETENGKRLAEIVGEVRAITDSETA